MCGRYVIAPKSRSAWATVGEVFGASIEDHLAALKPRYNVAPTQMVPIIVQDRDSMAVRAASARWGLIPGWWKETSPPRFSTINARSEEAADKPFWRHAFAKQRCLLPATHWYEWQKAPDGGKDPWVLTTLKEGGFCFAGLWSVWTHPESGESIHTAAILTRDASESVAHIHDRMPVILHPSGWQHWLNPTINTAAAAKDLLATYTVGEAQTWAVTRAVNSSRAEGPDLLEPRRG